VNLVDTAHPSQRPAEQTRQPPATPKRRFSAAIQNAANGHDRKNRKPGPEAAFWSAALQRRFGFQGGGGPEPARLPADSSPLQRPPWGATILLCGAACIALLILAAIALVRGVRVDDAQAVPSASGAHLRGDARSGGPTHRGAFHEMREMKALWQGFNRFLQTLHPVRLVALGYLSYVFGGWLLLALPFCHATVTVSALDALFTATSAVSTTGLVTVSTGNDYSIPGQVIILILIQLGGIGYMTFGSFVVLSRSAELTERRQQIGKAVFSMPEGFRIDKFIRSVIAFTCIIEAAGAYALFRCFRVADMDNPAWSAVFHSVSAFCTAGFGLYDDSFEGLRGNVPVNMILGALSYFGAIGFIVVVDAWRRLIGKTARLTLTSRIILVTTCWLSVGATILFFVAEPTIQTLPSDERLTAAMFQVMTSITTVGFNTIPIGGLSQASLFLIILLMVIGASPAGTGGGLKTTTFSAVFGVIRSALLGRRKVTFWGREIPEDRIRVAIASLGFYVGALILGCYLLALTESLPFEGLLFESASALGTVGLSTGITALLTPIGKLILIGLMFIGRLGPLAFGVALFFPPGRPDAPGKEDLAV
jgi:trk system potassium uptake protein TrkH